MTTKPMTKRSDGVSFAEFARLINRSKGYVSQMKSANRLVLTDDGKRLLVEESRARMKATSDPGKWPVAVSHDAERRRKSKVSEQDELIADPYDTFLKDVFSDAMPHICAELMLDSGITLREAADAYLAVCRAIDVTREAQGYESRLSVSMTSPTEQAGDEEWKREKLAEIERLVLESR